MDASSLKRLVLPIAIIVAGLAASVMLTDRLAQQRPALPDGYADSDLTINGSRVKGFALGMEGLLADWYWMRALLYIGDKLLSSKSENVNLDDLRDLNPRLLYPYLENATDLDPHFIAVYTYGAIVMPAIDPEKAIAIARKGIANNPEQWRLYQHLGYIYWRFGRYDEAAQAYDDGSRVAGAPPFMKLMSASMRTEGGSRDTAREVFRQMLDGTNDQTAKITAERHLAELDSLDDRDAIDNALGDFREKNGRCVADLKEIIPMLMQVRLPGGRDFSVDNARNLVDPSGVPYLLDRENCQAKLDAERTGLHVAK